MVETESRPDLEDSTGLRALGLLLVLGLLCGGALYLLVGHLFDVWAHRWDIRADFSPDQEAGRPFGNVRGESPSGDRSAVLSSEGLLIVEGPDQRVLADLGHADEVTFLTEDLLVAFGQGPLHGGFEGLAVIDLAAESVDQVDTQGNSINGYQPLSITADGEVEACELVLNENASTPTCGGRFFIDPDTAQLHLA